MSLGSRIRYYAGQYQHDDLTPLERRTQRRYDRCVAGGGHRDSGQTVIRRHGNHDDVMIVCRRCKVPVTEAEIEQRGRGAMTRAAEGRTVPPPRPRDDEQPTYVPIRDVEITSIGFGEDR